MKTPKLYIEMNYRPENKGYSKLPDAPKGGTGKTSSATGNIPDYEDPITYNDLLGVLGDLFPSAKIEMYKRKYSDPRNALHHAILDAIELAR